MFKLLISTLGLALPISVLACPQPMPDKSAPLALDDFDLGTCWVKETLQEFGKKGKMATVAETDQFDRLIAELVNYIPLADQRQSLVGLLTTQPVAKSLQISVLKALGSLHLLTPEARSSISLGMANKDRQIRGQAILAAAQVNPTDPSLQEQVVNAFLHDPTSDNRDIALSGIYLRTDAALAALKTTAKNGRDTSLQGHAQVTLANWQAHPTAVSPSKSMAVLGDSISVGFFADTSLLNAANYKVAPGELNILWFLSQSNHDAQMDRVWASGGAIESHLMRIKDQLKRSGKSDDVEVYNIARAEGTTSDLFGQIADLEEKMLLEPNQRLIYVTLFMGSNDVCHGLGPQTIAKNIERALARINRLQSRSQVVVMLASLPPIYQLGAADIAGFPGLAGLTCQAVQRDHMKFCSQYSAITSATDYAANQSQIEKTNAQLALAAESAQSLENLQVVFGAGLGKVNLRPEYLAIDCFHPNQDGQQAIADVLWNDLETAGVRF